MEKENTIVNEGVNCRYVSRIEITKRKITKDHIQTLFPTQHIEIKDIDIDKRLEQANLILKNCLECFRFKIKKMMIQKAMKLQIKTTGQDINNIKNIKNY